VITSSPSGASVPPNGPGDAIHASELVRRHPDRRTTWIIVVLARLEPGALPPVHVLLDRLESAATAFPLMFSRLRGSWWVPAPGPSVSVATDAEPLAVAPLQPLSLKDESPLRVMTPTGGEWLLLCAHHFAFDGLGMVELLRTLLTGEAAEGTDYMVQSSPRRLPIDVVRRFFRPADRVLPSTVVPPVDSFAARQITLSGSEVTARLARASAAAAAAHNAQRGQPIQRIGLSVAVGGVNGEAATYRRLDVVPGQDVKAAVTASLADPRIPGELAALPRGAFVLRPILPRFSDTLLVSNLGRRQLPGVTGIEFYPVARGRSGVAIGAAGIAGHPTTLTMRARDLSPREAATLLDAVVDELEHEP
jgi:hypothetical protein